MSRSTGEKQELNDRHWHLSIGVKELLFLFKFLTNIVCSKPLSMEHHKISEFWRKEYSNEIRDYEPFEISEQFKKIAALFTPGVSYFYVLNVHNLELDFISPQVRDFVGPDADKVTIETLLNLATPGEVEKIVKKEKVIKDFYTRFLPKEKITTYKLVYTYKMKDFSRKERIMLHQATPISTTEKGCLQHVLSIHTDVSHLVLKSTSSVSFIDLNGKNSFYNIDPHQEKFDPCLAKPEPAGLSCSLSKRELEVLENITSGLNTKEIAKKLCVSSHTVQTHRKNIMKKCGCKNTAELVAETMVAGLIS